MPHRATRPNSAVRLPLAVGIGFTGHRNLPDEPLVGRLIRDVLMQERIAIPGPVYGVSSAAAGADLLFAESCIELGIPVRVLLPLELEEFRTDFDQPTWQRVETVMTNADSVEVVARGGSREEAYYECGIATVQESRILVAVWDGEASRGKGGTANIICFARAVGRPICWIHSHTGKLRWYNEKKKLEFRRDPELEFLNGLSDGTARPAEAARELAQAWFQKTDENASRFAPRTRRLASLPFIYTAAAALSSEAALWKHGAEAWLGLSIGLGVVAAGIPAALRLDQRHGIWARTRTAAETCRSALALWNAPGFEGGIDKEMVPHLSGVLASLNFLKLVDPTRRAVNVDEFKASYLGERVRDQIEYFTKHAAHAKRQARAYRVTSSVCVALAILAAAWLFGANVLAPTHAVHGYMRERLALCTSILFQIATVASALIAVHDCDRRQRRYTEMRNVLEKWNRELEALRAWPPVLRVTGRIERALAIELLEWRALLENRKLAGK
jgi:hypothetical protein